MLMKLMVSPEDAKEAYAERIFLLIANKLPNFIESCVDDESTTLKESVKQALNESNHIVDVEQAISKLIDRIVEIEAQNCKEALEQMQAEEAYEARRL